MLHSPFFSAFSGTQEMQPHTLAAGLADLKEGSQWGGRSRIGEVQGGGGVGGCCTVSRSSGFFGFLLFSSPHWPYCLLVARGQPSSRRLDSECAGLVKAVGH